jgi:hypothetical protein
MRERRSSDRRPVPQFRAVNERVVRRLTEDHMIEELDTEDLSRLSEAGGQGNILLRGLWYAARVVVADDDRGGVRNDCRLEDLAGLCCGSIYVV